ncbi:glutathione S-transferase family protein [Synechococcus sp. NOUM97013]|uniref:glutathione S-transferase family protein n=1 Tax=Synechococcus sp. NOUM97013 TaxID=1442555 RepID=UPI001645CE08|nr:glutathione S-transferase [Synechococcus sp. NOUM97013]QNI73899.1 glutathione S-transferase [Synechococcus sp. NOUM97013]
MVEANPTTALSWSELEAMAPPAAERVEGPANAQATLRLFGQPESSVRVTLFRDHHAWCPYCQKVWLWLEFRRIPYRIRKVTMRCYGPKEPWFTALVPSGMLPALELDGRLLTESDRILEALERTFGPVGVPMGDRRVRALRDLERLLFRAWCIWLCTPGLNERQERQARDQFQVVARQMEDALAAGGGSWLDPESPGGAIPGTADLVFIPYVERMNASLAYFKGFALRNAHPGIDRWLSALEQLETYRGTQSDVHTHAHDLPPQMGGCWADGSEGQRSMAAAVDAGQGLGALESRWTPALADGMSRERALERVLRHRSTLLARNPLGDAFDQPLRAALTTLMQERSVSPEPGSAAALRYLRDRISVPRDMPLHSARLLRQALEATAVLDGDQQPTPLPFEHRFDQDPRPFL